MHRACEWVFGVVCGAESVWFRNQGWFVYMHALTDRGSRESQSFETLWYGTLTGDKLKVRLSWCPVTTTLFTVLFSSSLSLPVSAKLRRHFWSKVSDVLDSNNECECQPILCFCHNFYASTAIQVLITIVAVKLWYLSNECRNLFQKIAHLIIFKIVSFFKKFFLAGCHIYSLPTCDSFKEVLQSVAVPTTTTSKMLADSVQGAYDKARTHSNWFFISRLS